MTQVDTFVLGPFANKWFKAYRLINLNHVVVELIDYGATVTKIETVDRVGARSDILLGCPHVGDYAGRHPHFNCIVGRYANRITNARISVDGVTYPLGANIPPHQLHGGARGLHQKSWQSEVIKDGVRLWTTSPDLEEGFPGNLDVEAVYRLDRSNRLCLTLRAQTDQSTPVSLTSHHYYNLSGRPGSDVLDHEFEFAATRFLPIASDLTQLGEIRPIRGTPFDFSAPSRLDDKLAEPDEQMQLAGGFDHHFVLPDAASGQEGDLRFAARARHPGSGRWLRIETDQPGFQFYTGNSLDTPGKDGIRYRKHGGFCIETQQFPDAPNHPNYPNTIIRPGQTFEATTRFEFGCD